MTLTYNGQPIKPWGPGPSVARARWSVSRSPKKIGVVVHTYEGPETLSMDRIVAVIQTPGDRPVIVNGVNTGRYYGPCYHAFADHRTGGYVQVLDAYGAPFAAGTPSNATMWHICIPGYARQTRADWLDAVSLSQLRGVARFIVDRWQTDKFPLEKVSAAGLKAGRGGLCGHVDVSAAWGGDHWDPGPNFPWDILDVYIRELLEDEMALVCYITNDDGTLADDRPWFLSAGLLNRTTDGAVGAFRAFLPKLVSKDTVKLPRGSLRSYRPVNGVVGPFQVSEFMQ